MKIRYRKWSRWLALAIAIPLILCAIFHPVNSGVLRLITIGAIVTTALTLLLWNWRDRLRRTLVVCCIGVGLVPLILPNRPVDAIALHRDYIQALANFEGTRYHWGGETFTGIDCSGLPRRALQQAMLSQGLKQLNGDLIRKALFHWWFDASAEALAVGYRNYAVPLDQTINQPTETSSTIRTMSYDELNPGDFAVTGDRLHLIVYLGNNQWIQADPGSGRVLTLNGYQDNNPWFQRPVTMHRWAILNR
ncbi:MAG: NlpC/P60 family protein [Cyanobacteria bacterium P01_D01_bin.73]